MPAEKNALICFALRDEATPFLRLLENRHSEKISLAVSPTRPFTQPPIPLWRGQIGKTKITVTLTGIGPAAANKAARVLLEKLAPCLVISSGFAGALRTDLHRGNIVIPELVTDEADSFACSASLTAHNPQPTARCSKLISVPRIIATAAQKRSLHQRTGAAAVDMESASIARVCREKNIPFLVIRIISDEIGEDLPTDFNLLMGDDQQPSPAKATKHFLRHPRQLAATLKMRRQLRGHATKLGEFLHDEVTRY